MESKELNEANLQSSRSLSDKIVSAVQGPFMIVCMLAFFGYGILTLGAGWAGIEDAFGSLWGWIAIIAALVFRFTLPITIGAFLAALNIWNWHWFFALLFAAPGLAFMIPGLIVALAASVKSSR